MSFKNDREERRNLKQKLFQIRLFVEGDRESLTSELKKLRQKYEKQENFTSWSDFPEKWDIGDPKGVKSGYINMDDPSLSPVDKANFKKLQGREFEEIIHLDQSDARPDHQVIANENEG